MARCPLTCCSCASSGFPACPTASRPTVSEPAGLSALGGLTEAAASLAVSVLEDAVVDPDSFVAEPPKLQIVTASPTTGFNLELCTNWALTGF